jgi:hypothetical protein
MKTKDIYELKKGDKINHKHYGICKVEGIIPHFGVLIIPFSEEKQELLKRQGDTVEMFRHMPKGTPLLETSFRLITGKIS